MQQALPVIRVRDLYKIYEVGENHVYALNGVSFDVRRGEFCSIVGTSGSGKSTLLNMLAGLESPTHGMIEIAGQRIEQLKENELVRYRREKVGFIFQSFNLLSSMTALENVALPLRFRRVPKLVRLKRASMMLRAVGLADHADHHPNQMSGGQQQRVGIARALVVNPDIIFADEPTGNLDSNTTAEIMGMMQRIVGKFDKTLIMVTHDDHIAGFADRIFHINDGRISDIEDGRTRRGEG